MLGRQMSAKYYCLFVSAAMLAAGQGAGAVAAGERLAMPFRCDVRAGALQLSPSPDQTYSIIGTRQERVVLACASGRPVQCRTMIAHNFVVDCGGQKVAWERIAEAIGGRRSSRVWRSPAGGQLNISMVEPDTGGARQVSGQPCSGKSGEDSDPAASKLVERVAMVPCEDRSGGRELNFALPAGFAPLAHFGAQLVSTEVGAAREPARAQDKARPSVVVAAAPAEQHGADARQRLLERTILSEPLPEIGVADVPQTSGSDREELARASGEPARATAPDNGVTGALPSPNQELRSSPPEGVLRDASQSAAGRAGQRLAQSAPHGATWNATVMVAGDGLSGAGASMQADATVVRAEGSQRGLVLWLLLTSLFVTTGWMAWARNDRLLVLARRMTDVPGVGPAISGVGTLGAGLAARAGATLRSWGLGTASVNGQDGPRYPAVALEAVMLDVSRVVQGLPRDVPLRGVLDDELARVRQRLSVAKASSPDADGLIPVPAYRVLMRDLERIRRIGASAQESVPMTATPRITLASSRMPSTRQEAFEILGLNPNVGDATVKKCVDALRMSWHPDLAQDAADLAAREERIKQINVAAELIASKPSEA